MTPYAYQVLKPHICAKCGVTFMSGHPNARYHSLKCQRSAAALRRRGRDAAAVTHDDRFYTTIHDPTVAQLESVAKDLLLDLTNGKPILLTGNVPRYTPKGVMIHQTQNEELEFIMDKYVPDIMDAFK